MTLEYGPPHRAWGVDLTHPTSTAAPPLENLEKGHLVTERLKEKKEPSLGELNPLIYGPDFGNPDAIEALKTVVLEKINKYGGLPPETFETVLVYDEGKGEYQPRLIFKFRPDSLTEEQVVLLEDLIRSTYSASVRTRHNVDGNYIPPSSYPSVEKSSKKPPKTKSGELEKGGKSLGWYLGPAHGPVARSNSGLFIYRDLGDAGMADYLRRHGGGWFFEKELVNPYGKLLRTGYLVECREAGLPQTDLCVLAIQVSMILGKQKLSNPNDLLYEVYNDLNRIGLRKDSAGMLSGIQDQIDEINRVLIYPLANIDLASGIKLPAGSVLLVGLPGTGKTYAAEWLLQQDTGVFILPMEAQRIADELKEPVEKRPLFARINRIFNRTGRPVILHIDDIENLAEDEKDGTNQESKKTNSTLLNLMKGIRENGFFILASTNHPERLKPELLQPQRFAHIIYFGFQDDPTRLHVLNVHATRVSQELGLPLFSSDHDRHAILKALVDHTEKFVPRFLADICTEAKAFFLQRIALIKGRASGLTEVDLRGEQFTEDDWVNGFGRVNNKYNKSEMEKRDAEIREFIKHTRAGFLWHKEDVDQSVGSLRAALSQSKNGKAKDTPEH